MYSRYIQSYRINLKIVHYLIHPILGCDQQRDKRCRNRRREEIRPGRIRWNGSATRELHKPVQASLYDTNLDLIIFFSRINQTTIEINIEN